MFLGDCRNRSVAGILLAIGLVVGCSIKTTTTSTTGTTGAEDGKTSGAASGAAAGDSETISAEGSSTVYPICQTLAVEFQKTSHHKVSIAKTGTGGGFKTFSNRQADIWNASRPIDEEEINVLKKKGIEWLELNVAVDGIVVAVNSSNTWCSNLTCAQLKRIWEPDSKVEKWSDLDPSWPAEQLLLYGADTDSGTFEYFTEVINDKKKATNIKYTPSSDDNILVQGIAGNKFALGYIPFGYYVYNTEKLKALGVSKSKDASETPAPFVEPTVETIISGEYTPLARPLFMYTNTSSLLTRPAVADFLTFVVSDKAQPLIEKRGFVPNSEDVRRKMQSKLQVALTPKVAK